MPPVQATRADTLDGILDELPDFSDGYFSYPVDDFFPQYVERLGQGGVQEASQENGQFSHVNLPSTNISADQLIRRKIVQRLMQSSYSMA